MSASCSAIPKRGRKRKGNVTEEERIAIARNGSPVHGHWLVIDKQKTEYLRWGLPTVIADGKKDKKTDDDATDRLLSSRMSMLDKYGFSVPCLVEWVSSIEKCFASQGRTTNSSCCRRAIAAARGQQTNKYAERPRARRHGSPRTGRR